jgi:hypothetical protein
MPQKETAMDRMVNAYTSARQRAVEALRTARAEVVTRPADPNATRLTGDAWLAEYEATVNDPARMESLFLELKQRHNVPDGAVPRRLVDYLKLGQRRLAEREKQPRGD